MKYTIGNKFENIKLDVENKKLDQSRQFSMPTLILRPGIVLRSVEGELRKGVFRVAEGLNKHVLCWYSIEGKCNPPKAMQKAIYSFFFLTGRISNYVLIVDAETILQDVD
jgi:hypothetical protein